MASCRQRGWKVPGFGLALQWPRVRHLENKPHPIGDEDILLRSALDNSSDPAYCYTVRELTMLAWINELTDMFGWQEKIFDPDFTFKWKSAKVMTGYDVTRSMADWCVEEVQYYIHDRISTSSISTLDGGVIKSDSCVDAATKLGLQEAAAVLRRCSRGHECEVDVVDPYLFPLAWDKTRLLRKGSIRPMDCVRRCGEGEVATMPPEDDCKEPDHGRYRNDMAYSRRFQWLPFDVVFGNGGLGGSRIQSYINNVHPLLHSALYCATERLIDAFIPLFERTIIDLKAPGYLNQRIHLVDFARDPFIKRDPDSFRPPVQRADESVLNADGQYQNILFVDLKREFWNTGLQMVLHLQDINLLPERNEYEGEEWHVQGQTNERICASASYIYSTSNLSSTSPPQLSFRCSVFTEEAMAARGAVRKPPYLPEIYGVKHGDPAIQTMGHIVFREGRVVVWPNTFQTRILPFSLDDRSKPGHCRILTLHLIDPNRRIMSTGMVPCQRRDWWASSIRTSIPLLWRLPREIFNKIVDEVDQYPISMEEGLRMRDDFQAERRGFRERHTQAMVEYDEWDFYGEPGVREESDEE